MRYLEKALVASRVDEIASVLSSGIRYGSS